MPRLILSGLIASALFGSAPAVTAQSALPAARNAVYAEIGGSGLLYSLNYDRRFRDNVTGRIGFMYMSAEGTSEQGETVDVTVAIFPLMMNLLIGSGSGRLELGAGPIFIAASGEAETLDEGDIDVSAFGLGALGTAIGYRYQPSDGGLVFRASLTPFLSDGLQFWGGVSFGYAF